MSIQDLINQLSKYPPNLDLSEIKTTVAVEKELRANYIRSVYVADHRIAGNHPWGRLQHMERQTDLGAVAASLLQGLKFNKNDAKC